MLFGYTDSIQGDMRIVFAVHTYFPETNGVQAVTQYLAEYLAKQNDVIVISGKNGKVQLADEEVYNNVKIYRVMAYQKKGGYKFGGDKEKYITLLKEFHPDVFVCVCTQSWQFNWIQNEINQIEGKKVLYTHDFSGLYPYGGKQRQGLMRWLFGEKHRLHWNRYYKKHSTCMKKFDVVTHLSAVSESLRYAEKIGIKNNVILGNATEDIFFATPVCYDETRFKNKADIRYVCVSNFSAIKNQAELIKAFFKANVGASELVLIGSTKSTYYQQLVDLYHRLKKENEQKKVFFLTGLTRQEIAEQLENSDVYVTTSQWEGYSVSMLEAAAKGLAIVSTNVGNARIIPGTVVVDNVCELPYVLEELYNDAKTRMKTGQTLRCYAEKKARIIGRASEFEALIKKL